ncbi:uncharacterized protein rusc1 isoform 1-T1 [Synchiropus picturatus]
MQSAQSQKPKRFDVSRRTTTVAARKPYGLKEDKNMNTIPSSSPRRITKGPTAALRTRVPVQPRAPVGQSRFGAQKQASSVPKSFKPKPKSTRAAVVAPVAPAPAPPPLPSSLPLDPNCNEPSLPCLCCDGRSPQDNNSMFNHNHNNNNTISLRQQMQLPPPPPVLPQRQEVTGTKKQLPSLEQGPIEAAVCPALLRNDQENVARSSEVTKKGLEDDEEESSGDIDIDVDEDDNDDDEDDDTLVPSCCDCPPSLLEFSLSSSTSSSSTSISSCSDLDSDSADPSESLCSSYCQDHLSITMSPKDDHFLHCTESRPPTRSPPSLPLNGNPFLTSQSAVSSPDEGYPSALDSPSPDYLGVKSESEVASLGLLDFLESVGEFGKMERFSQVIQVARWDLEGEQHWDVLRDRLDHLDRLEKVNREVKLYYIAKLHEKGYDLGDLDEQDLSDVLDEMGNIDIPLKLYKNRVASMADSQEFSDAGVDLTAPSDSEDPLAPDSLTPSPVEPPSRPPKPPVRHASVNSDLHTYINISRETVSMAVTTSPTLTTFSLNSSSPTFSTFRCEKSLPPSPPSIPPLPSSKPIQYLSLYTTSSPPPSIPTPTPPIPPPRKRHLARKEAQRLAALQAEQEKTPVSLPPPTTSPPPLPPPPVISVSCSSSPPAIPPPPALPPPPSFHALDVEIRKLLMLAGLTQADLLKLSPELGVCVTGLEEEADEDNQFSTCSSEQYSFRLKDEVAEESDSEFSIRDGWSKQLSNQSAEIPVDPRGGKVFNESKDTQRKTSFTEIARRRKRNSGVTTDLYYTTDTSNTYETKETFNYPSTPPPPPPPRPLPPIPPSLPALKVSTLSANSARPERFDWLIAFTPEADSQPETTQPKICDITKPDEESVKTNTSSGSSTGSAPRVTTFKELRNRNKSAPPPTKVITDPEPDPTIITPDPDILYNLKWRREKAGSDGNQWEYTSQAQALFMQPPPALTSMAALKEMLQRADQEGGQAELYPSLKIGYPVNDSRFLTTDRECEELKEEWKDKPIVEERGRADGRRTTESQTTVSSPPLSLSHRSQPYFLHSDLTTHHGSFCSSPPRPHTHIGQETSPRASPHKGDGVTGLHYESLVHFSGKSPSNGNIFQQCSDRDVTSDSLCNLDSLYCSESETPTKHSDVIVDPGSITPYKNIDVMMTTDSLYSGSRLTHANHDKNRAHKELPPLPTYYLYHPKNCPLHRGAPPRLSPIGALSPPQRSGVPPVGTVASCLNSPLFPRSHTLPALAAPLYYPNLYPAIPPRVPPRPPKLQQTAVQPSTVHSVSFTGAAQREEPSWMGEEPMSLSSVSLREKKALVSAVSQAVEAILAQFSSSRTVVQKALSGDSAVNPSLGRLVLQCLCPALHRLLTDGLKPHQSDLIAGRRPNSAWGLVQASTRPGLKTQALYNLQNRVGELPQLRQSKHKFNAFIFGLLNAKLLDFWLSHLQTCIDVLDTFYYPSSFMLLSLTACQHVYQELLLVLQPLSLLTFNLDLLFQHHHLETHSPQIPSPPSCGAGVQQPARKLHSKPSESRYFESLSGVDFGNPDKQDGLNSGKSSSGVSEDWCTETSPQLMWVQEKRIADLPPPNMEEDSLAQQAGQVIQQGWGAMMRWGGRLSQNLTELSLSAARKEDMKTDLSELPDQAVSDFAPLNSSAQVPWGLGRLFGASRCHSAPSRRPSQWLAPGVTALTRIMSSSSTPAPRNKDSVPLENVKPVTDSKINNVVMDTTRPLRSVRMLCDHKGSGSELSFSKGEELVVLGGIDQDWIRCRQGDKEGLVQIGYTSIIM